LEVATFDDDSELDPFRPQDAAALICRMPPRTCRKTVLTSAADDFFSLIVTQARQKRLPSAEQFIVDGTLVEAWAGVEVFPKAKKRTAGRGRAGMAAVIPRVDYHPQRRSDEIHQSLTDPLARLFKNSHGRKPSWALATENRQESSWTRPDACHHCGAGGRSGNAGAHAIRKARDLERRLRLRRGFVAKLRGIRVSPHIAQNTGHRSAIDGHTTRPDGYDGTQPTPSRGGVFGWLTIALTQHSIPRSGSGGLDVHPSRRPLTTLFECEI
jgi:hypothetical protein